MAADVEISDLLTSDRARNATTLTNLLQSIREVLDLDPWLSDNVPFKVTKRGQKGIDEHSKLLKYKGPDEETVQELKSKCIGWFNDPQSFWDEQRTPRLQFFEPQATIVACFIQRSRSDKSRYGNVPPAVIADSICNSHLSGVDTVYVEKTIEKIISRGSYYRSLEQALGAGVTLALGTDVAESTWTRVLTKKGTKFDAIINHLKETSLATMAQEYSCLRIQLVNHHLQTLLQPCGALSVAPAIPYHVDPMSARVDMGPAISAQDDHPDIALECIDFGDQNMWF